MNIERPGGERIPPVVEVSDDERWQSSRFPEQVVLDDMPRLPVPLLLGQSEMQVCQMQRANGRFNHDQLSTAWLALMPRHGNLVMASKRPARHQQVSIAAVSDLDVELKQMTGRLEPLNEHLWLIVKSTATDVSIDLLQADDVGRLGFDDVDDSFKAIQAVSAADTLVNVETQEPHARSPANDGCVRVHRGLAAC